MLASKLGLGTSTSNSGFQKSSDVVFLARVSSGVIPIIIGGSTKPCIASPNACTISGSSKSLKSGVLGKEETRDIPLYGIVLAKAAYSGGNHSGTLKVP